MCPLKNKLFYDAHIINALSVLPPVMINNEGSPVFIRKKARQESGREHIARASHGLQVKDIQRIPEILKSPFKVCLDPTHKCKKNYYGIKYKKHVFAGFIKIVTAMKQNKEEIVTIFVADKIKE